MHTLLERSTAGLSIMLGWESLTNALLLVCQRSGQIAIADVPPEKARDAFEHPACYLAADDLPLLYAKSSHAEEDD